MRVVESRQMGSCEAHVKLPPLYLGVCLMTPRLSWHLALWGRLSPGLVVIDKNPPPWTPTGTCSLFNFNRILRYQAQGRNPGYFVSNRGLNPPQKKNNHQNTLFGAEIRAAHVIPPPRPPLNIKMILIPSRCPGH